MFRAWLRWEIGLLILCNDYLSAYSKDFDKSLELNNVRFCLRLRRLASVIIGKIEFFGVVISLTESLNSIGILVHNEPKIMRVSGTLK